MRVTNAMTTNTVVFNMQRSLRRYLELQTAMSSGRRINKPSDDPLGTLRDLDYRSELSKIEQYQSNISQGQNWLNTYDTTIADVKDLLSEAREVAVAMANETYDESARLASANEIESIIDQIARLANTQMDGRHMFSGYKTRTEPLDFANNGVVYRGDNGLMQFEIESGQRQAMNITAQDLFLKSFAVLGKDADINVAVTTDTLLSDLNGGEGLDLTTGTFTITDANLVGGAVTIDLNAAPPATTVGEALTKINDQLTTAGLNGAVSVSISDDGNGLKIDTTATGEVSTATQLSRLHSGAGMTGEVGEILVSTGAGVDVVVDLSSAETLDDVITEFNTQLAAAGLAGVTMGINATNTGLVINDANLPPLDLTISNASPDDETASDLGIAGSLSAQLVGSDLEPEAAIVIAETTGSTAAGLGLVGTYHHDTSGGDIDPLLVASALVSDWFNGLGAEGDSIVLSQGERSLTVDFSDPGLATVQDVLDYINSSGLDVTAEINDAGTGIQVVNNDTTRSFSIEEIDDGRTAKRMGLYGASDMMSTLLVLHNALEDNDSEALDMLLDELDDAMTVSLEGRADIGSRAMRLEITDSRLSDLHLSFTSLLSEVEDADITKVITDLATQESSYQAALAAASKIIQPSLLDFLTY